MVVVELEKGRLERKAFPWALWILDPWRWDV
jgi:hypothetical protein